MRTIAGTSRVVNVCHGRWTEHFLIFLSRPRLPRKRTDILFITSVQYASSLAIQSVQTGCEPLFDVACLFIWLSIYHVFPGYICSMGSSFHVCKDIPHYSFERSSRMITLYHLWGCEISATRFRSFLSLHGYKTYIRPLLEGPSSYRGPLVNSIDYDTWNGTSQIYEENPRCHRSEL